MLTKQVVTWGRGSGGYWGIRGFSVGTGGGSAVANKVDRGGIWTIHRQNGAGIIRISQSLNKDPVKFLVTQPKSPIPPSLWGWDWTSLLANKI